jgi:hypothetical protein
MKVLLEEFERTFYTQITCAIFALIGLIIFLTKQLPQSSLKIFRYYFAGFIIIQLITYSFVILWANNSPYKAIAFHTFSHSDFLFTILEYFVFSSFLKPFLNKRLVFFNSCLFVLICIGLYIYSFLIYRKYSEIVTIYLFTAQAILLLILCANYYVSLFKGTPTKNLIEEPSFWVATGLTFFMLSTLPFSIFSFYLHKHNHALYVHLFTLFFLFYILLFSMIIKASLCRPVRNR